MIVYELLLLSFSYKNFYAKNKRFTSKSSENQNYKVNKKGCIGWMQPF